MNKTIIPVFGTLLPVQESLQKYTLGSFQGFHTPVVWNNITIYFKEILHWIVRRLNEPYLDQTPCIDRMKEDILTIISWKWNYALVYSFILSSVRLLPAIKIIYMNSFTNLFTFNYQYICLPIHLNSFFSFIHSL